MRVAVVGSGISGLISAYVLAKNGVDVVLYEKENYLGGNAKTVTFEGVDLDLGFMVFNPATYPNMTELFESLGVETEGTDMSFSVSLDKGQGCEWGSRNGFSSLFAQEKNLSNPHFHQMIREIVKFKDDVFSYVEELENNLDIDRNESLGDFIKPRGYSELFQKAFLIPKLSSIWSCPSEHVMSFSAFAVLSFYRNNNLLQLFGQPQWRTVKGRSHSYVKKLREAIESRGCQIRSRSEVPMISTTDEGCMIHYEDGSKEMYDRCILAVHAPDAMRILGDQATLDERRVLGAFQYTHCNIYLHHDKTLMPQNSSAWSARNFLGDTRGNNMCLTYWLNVIQNLGDTSLPFLLTVNVEEEPKDTLLKWSTKHFIPSVATFKASLELHRIQGKRGIWFAGAYQGYGFHEDGVKAGISAANGILGKSCDLILSHPKHMVPSDQETGARLLVTRFLKQFISAGCLILLEAGGNTLTFEGSTKKCPYKSVIKVHSSKFYGKVMTQADLGLADAYINGDFSFVDEDEGLLNLFLILIANRDSNPTIPGSNKNGEIFALGSNIEKFLGTWECYFDCAAGFKSRIPGDSLIVFSRPGKVAVLGNSFPSPR